MKKKYTEHDMILFALYYGVAIAEARLNDAPLPSAKEAFKDWKTKL